jgi:DNA-binding MarR family transcriptional regulator
MEIRVEHVDGGHEDLSLVVDRNLTNTIDRSLSSFVNPSPTSDPLLGLLLRLVHQHWAAEIDAALAEAGFEGIRPPHAAVFPFVDEEGTSVSELARRANVRKQTMREAVEELEQLGYVERRPDPADRRSRLVLLTARGEAVRPVTHTVGRTVEERWGELIGRPRLDDLRAGLVQLLRSLDATE